MGGVGSHGSATRRLQDASWPLHAACSLRFPPDLAGVGSGNAPATLALPCSGMQELEELEEVEEGGLAVRLAWRGDVIYVSCSWRPAPTPVARAGRGSAQSCSLAVHVPSGSLSLSLSLSLSVSLSLSFSRARALSLSCVCVPCLPVLVSREARALAEARDVAAAAAVLKLVLAGTCGC